MLRIEFAHTLTNIHTEMKEDEVDWKGRKEDCRKIKALIFLEQVN